jgi:predicted dehydrogenase
MGRLLALLAEGVIGEVQLLVADLSIQFDFDPADRRYALELGGGALLDLGVYLVSFASMVMGPPSRVEALAHLGETGVDEQTGIMLGYDRGQMSTLYCSLRVNSPIEATIIGTKGHIRFHPWWIRPSKLSLRIDGQETTSVQMPYEGNGYQFEAMAVMDCLRAGRLESDIMPLDETLSIMHTLDELRHQWGLTYPTE